MQHILIVEDDLDIQELLKNFLQEVGYAVTLASDGIEAISLFASTHFDLILLDIMLPKIDGFTVCELIRKQSSVPIIMLTAKSEEEDKLKGYELGADDYITKPFSPKVLLAKVGALLRRSSITPTDSVNAGKITIIPTSHKVFVDGQEINLTHKEYELLYFFMGNPGQIFSREQLLNRIWGYDFEGTTRTVDTHIKTLRQKLGDEGKHIVTLIRSGYKFEVSV